MITSLSNPAASLKRWCVVLLIGAFLPTTASAQSTVYVDGAGVCNGLTPCVTTIQDGVGSAFDPDGVGGATAEVFVFPGTYPESVDFSAGPGGDIALTTVAADGTPTPGTVTVSPASGDGFHMSFSPYNGYITMDGFIIQAPDGSGIALSTVAGIVSVLDCVTNGTNGSGMVLDASQAHVTGCSSSANDVDGILIIARAGIAAIENCSANDNGQTGIQLSVPFQMTIAGSTANGNGRDGIELVTGTQTLTISDTQANGNGDGGIVGESLALQLSRCQANDNMDGHGIDMDVSGAFGELSLNQVVASRNSIKGIFIQGTNGLLEVLDCTTNGNMTDGAEFRMFQGDIDVRNFTGRNNDFAGVRLLALNAHVADSWLGENILRGAFFQNLTDEGSYSITGSIICDNGSGIEISGDARAVLDATGNLWGSLSGPTHPDNAGGTGDEIIDGGNGGDGTASFEPWIDTISQDLSPDPKAGLTSNVLFSFTGGADTVSLGLGPGDRTRPEESPFEVSTDNGTMEFAHFAMDLVGSTVPAQANASGGVFAKLVPDAEGPVIVTLTGPCGIVKRIERSAVAAVADVRLTKTDEVDPVGMDAVITYKLAVANDGPDSAGGVVVSDKLPAHLNLVSVDSTKGECVFAGDTLTCDIGGMPPGETEVVTIVVKPTESGKFLNVADVTTATGDPNPANNESAQETTVQGSMSSENDGTLPDTDLGEQEIPTSQPTSQPAAFGLPFPCGGNLLWMTMASIVGLSFMRLRSRRANTP